MITRFVSAPSIAVAMALTALASPAGASDRWEEAGNGAVAILPVPSKAKAITGGSLVCAEQKWNFRLRLDADAPLPATEVTMRIDDETLTAPVALEGSVLTIPVSYEDVDLMKAATRLTFAIGKGKEAPSASFSLRGSKLVIEAIAPRCSQIDMTGYDRVTLFPSGPAVQTATPLMAEEAGLFRDMTKKEPTLSAVVVGVPDQRSLLFASLCGSTWYYGRSGCTLSVFARSGAGSDWKPVFSSEGVVVYTDPKNGRDGWPDLVTLPMVGGTEATHWNWNGEGYGTEESAMLAGDETEGEDAGEGDIAQ